MTMEQQHLHQQNKEAAKKLAEEVTHFLRWLRDRSLKGEERDESGLWNCQDWLPQVLRQNQVQFKQERVYGEINRITFAMSDGTCVISGCELDIRMGRDEEAEGDSNPHYMGNLLQLSLHGNREDSNYRFRVRWLAYDGHTAESGMTPDEFHSGDWQFPDHTWCNLLGNHGEAREWLAMSKLILK
jgi:hypothetical protein